MSQEEQGRDGWDRGLRWPLQATLRPGRPHPPPATRGRSCGWVRFIVREGDHIRLVDADQVEAIQSTGNYMHLHVGRATHMIRETLGTLERRLEGRFVRVHRSWMVNLEAILEVRSLGRRGLVIRTTGGVQVPVSRAHRGGLDRLLQGALLWSRRSLSG